MSKENYAIIDSTLCEGEQFVNAFFSREDKIQIATLLDAFGVEYLELTSPLASPNSLADCEAVARLNLNTRVLTHTRCSIEDAKVAAGTGVDGVDVVIGTWSYLREFSHGKNIEQIIDLASEVVTYLLSQGMETRFSTEDSLRSDPDEIIRVYKAVDALGVHRVGIADTVGIGTPNQIYQLIHTLRGEIKADIEFHGHNDSGCAIANAYAALEAGATHIDTCVLGIGERNGITPLGGLIARLYATEPGLVSKYQLPLIRNLDACVARLVGVDIPFNNYITGFSSFSHKAGIHAKAVLNNPSTYEILKPEDFGLTRHIHLAHRLTGWNAIKNRVQQLNIQLNDQQIKRLTNDIKAAADSGQLTLDDVDSMLYEAAVNMKNLNGSNYR
ncbi:MAG: homocitrate synthase [Candidatus Promineifilaceae bacterium]